MILNPYIAGNPLKDQAAFFGREEIVREVMQMLRHPDEKAIVLFGQRRIGKTSILMQLDRRLAAEGQFTPIYFDLQDRASSPLVDVLYKLAQTIAIRLGRAMPARDQFDEEGVYFNQGFLPEIAPFTAPGGLVLLFDEFDVMDSPQRGSAGAAFFPYLRARLVDLQNVKFVFVIGRRPEELSTETLSTFKGIRATRVSVLDRAATEAVIRQSERKGSLTWTPEAVEAVWGWTKGHTFFTQLLCSVVWESIREKYSGQEPPQALPQDVDNGVPEAFKHGVPAFQWIWDGLPPAERVVMAAMAEAEGDIISQEDIEDILNRSGVRLIVRELKLAPATLVDWELLRPVEGNYRFTVPLLRYWVKLNRPLIRVKDELDRLDPLAEILFNSGNSFYGMGRPVEATQQLRQALTVNPNHLKSRLLLGRILLEQDGPEAIFESTQILEEAYRYDSSAAQADLVKSLLAYANIQKSEDQKLEILERILNIQPAQPLAQERLRAIWRGRGDAALEQGNFEAALQAFTQAGDAARIEKVHESEKQRWRAAGEAALQKQDFAAALQAFTQAGDAAGIEKVHESEKQRWRELGETALQRQDFAAALQAFSQAGDAARIEQVRQSENQHWCELGEAAIGRNDLAKALEIFTLLQDEARLAEINRLIDQNWVVSQVDLATQAEAQGDWAQAIACYQALLVRFPDEPRTISLLQRAQEHQQLDQLYQQALDLDQAGNYAAAQKLFTRILSIEPEYKDAARCLYLSVTKMRTVAQVPPLAPPPQSGEPEPAEEDERSSAQSQPAEAKSASTLARWINNILESLWIGLGWLGSSCVIFLILWTIFINPVYIIGNSVIDNLAIYKGGIEAVIRVIVFSCLLGILPAVVFGRWLSGKRAYFPAIVIQKIPFTKKPLSLAEPVWIFLVWFGGLGGAFLSQFLSIYLSGIVTDISASPSMYYQFYFYPHSTVNVAFVSSLFGIIPAFFFGIWLYMTGKNPGKVQ